MDGFLLGGRKIGAWMSAFAYGTSYFSAVIFVGYAGTHGWNIGFASIWIGVGNAVLGCFLAWKVLARRTRRMTRTLSARTMPEFFAARYLSPRMKIFAALIIFIFLVPYAAGVYKGLGAFFGVIFPGAENLIPGVSANMLCLMIVALLTGAYLILGGYLATAITDFAQGIIMLVGVVVMVVALVSSDAVGGLSQAVTALRDNAEVPHLTSLFGGSQWSFLLINILLTSFGTWALPQMVTKFYAVRDEGAIKRGTVVVTIFSLVIGCGAYFSGVFGRVALGNKLPEGGLDAVMPTMLTRVFGGEGNLGGNILLAVILILLLSASMSTLAAIVLSSSSAISVDLAQTVKKDIGRKEQMLLTRVLCLVFVGLSFLFAISNFSIIVSIMSYSWGVVSGCFIGPFVWGLYKKGITRAGAWAGMLGGFGTMLVMTLVYTLSNPALSDGFYAAFQAASRNSPVFGVTAMAVSVVLVPVVSRFTKKYDKAHVEAVFAVSEDQ
ncbi:MAG: sodium:solute symporter family protein [Oscillospiraceae bacterium]|nr:sodium:solute symporter family protein [Oscillospiraceae bacterium]